jgi:hypothetical protein
MSEQQVTQILKESKNMLDLPEEKFNKLCEQLPKIIRAIKGQDQPHDFISELMNKGDIRERSRFPTWIIVRAQAYRRFMAEQAPEMKPYADAADQHGHLNISFKGQGREEAIDYKKAEKAAEAGMSMQLFANPTQKRETEPKKHWWKREKKQEESDTKLVNE